jgi:hypothetical protein
LLVPDLDLESAQLPLKRETVIDQHRIRLVINGRHQVRVVEASRRSSRIWRSGMLS